MKITHYEFGRIRIEGKDYDSDVIISADGVQDQWWRKEGHNLDVEDLGTILQRNPELLIVGSGYYGRMKVPDKTRDYLVEKGVRVEVINTTEAVTKYNELQKECARIVAALHLTC